MPLPHSDAPSVKMATSINYAHLDASLPLTATQDDLLALTATG